MVSRLEALRQWLCHAAMAGAARSGYVMLREGPLRAAPVRSACRRAADGAVPVGDAVRTVPSQWCRNFTGLGEVPGQLRERPALVGGAGPVRVLRRVLRGQRAVGSVRREP